MTYNANDAESQVSALIEQCAKLRSVLLSVEWLPDTSRELYYCPACGGQGVHAEQCRLNLALTEPIHE